MFSISLPSFDHALNRALTWLAKAAPQLQFLEVGYVNNLLRQQWLIIERIEVGVIEVIGGSISRS
jgi:hypothetical protein